MRSTTKKLALEERTLSVVRENVVYKMERAFYDFAVAQFQTTYERVRQDGGRVQYHYEKVQPARLDRPGS